MKKLLAVALAALLLTGCAALPGEERSFAVTLGLSKQGENWEAGARIPTYQTGGGYTTVTATGGSLGEVLAMLNASAPMELHYGQLRLMVLSKELAEGENLPELLQALAERGEVRSQAAICVTEENITDLLDAMEPATGSRLSKSLEATIQARQMQGVLMESTLSGVVRLGERQQSVLMNAALKDKTVQLSGGWLMGSDGRAQGRLEGKDIQLLALMMGRLKQGALTLEEGTLTLLDTDCSIRLVDGVAQCRVKLRYGASNMTEEGVQRALITALQGLTARLAAANCDALGVGRQAMMRCLTMEEWRNMNWKQMYPALEWRFGVHAEREA